MSRINRPPTLPPPTPQPDERNINNSGEPVRQVAFDMKMDEIKKDLARINGRIDNSNLLIIGLLAALVICFITLFYGYWQFASTSYTDYSNNVKSLHNDRYQLLQDEYQFLKEKMASESGS